MMKTIKKAAILFLLIIGMMGLAPQKATAQVSVSFQLFYDDLSPHGYWVDNPNYGYIWVPNVSRGFAPYRTNGHWVFTEVGWTWVSNYSWGWAPFHYGRWFYDPYYGWAWVPDTHWGPAWVTWRYYDGYYGWAAIGPGISIDVAFSNGYNVPHNHWMFVREGDFGRRNISNYYVTNNTTIINNSRVINNVRTDNGGRYNAGPDRGDVQKRSKANIAQVNLKERGKPGQSLTNNELQLYRPRVERGDKDGRKPAPANVRGKNDVKPITERGNTTQTRTTQPKREVKKPDVVQPTRKPDNRERNIPQQKRQEVIVPRNDQRTKAPEVQRREPVPQQKRQEMQVPRNERRVNEPIPQQREMNRQRNDQSMDRNVPQIDRQDRPQQRANNEGRNPNREKPERNNKER